MQRNHHVTCDSMLTGRYLSLQKVIDDWFDIVEIVIQDEPKVERDSLVESKSYK